MIIHFVGGLGAAKGKPLTDLELISLKLAHIIYPEAIIHCWTLETTWLNMPEYCVRHNIAEHITKSWPNFTIKAGQHMSDKIRLYILLLFGGLYLDTDVLCLRRLPGEYLDKLCFAKQSRNNKSQLINNGIIYAPKPNNAVLLKYLSGFLTAKSIGKWEQLSCRNLYKAYLDNKEDCNLFKYYEFHGYGWPTKQLDALPKRINQAYFWHLIGKDKTLNSELILEYIQNELCLNIH